MRSVLCITSMRRKYFESLLAKARVTKPRSSYLGLSAALIEVIRKNIIDFTGELNQALNRHFRIKKCRKH